MLGNDDVNETKLEKILGSAIRPGHPDELKEITGADAGSIGPISFKGRIIADLRLKNGNNLFSGANKNDYHIGGIDLIRDVPELEYADLRTVKAGENCIRCGSKLDVFSAIELGHIFKLGTKYSKSMGALFLDENGKENPIVMGSYGIGVERIIACYVEQHHDDKGIIWDKVLAPFQVNLLALNMKKENVIEASDKIYQELSDAGITVLYDDRIDAQAGFKFNDADLLGMPVQVIVGDKKLKENKVEVKVRETGERFDIEVEKLKEKIAEIFRN
jgi:prolyl-tRNA synthetase